MIKPSWKYKKLLHRGLYAALGNTIISIGLTFMRYSSFGVDPISCLNTGVAARIGMSFGTWQLLISVVMLALMFVFDKSKIGFGTLYNMVTVGYTSDFLLSIIKNILLLEPIPLQIRIVSFILGFLILYFGVAVYIETNMGIAPYDAIAIIIAEKIEKQDWFKWIRIGTDVLCVIGGVLTKSEGVGIGTLLTALFSGPLIASFRKLKVLQNCVRTNGV
jgi:uncharacterized membrane protein YczE